MSQLPGPDFDSKSFHNSQGPSTNSGTTRDLGTNGGLRLGLARTGWGSKARLSRVSRNGDVKYDVSHWSGAPPPANQAALSGPIWLCLAQIRHWRPAVSACSLAANSCLQL